MDYFFDPASYIETVSQDNNWTDAGNGGGYTEKANVYPPAADFRNESQGYRDDYSLEGDGHVYAPASYVETFPQDSNWTDAGNGGYTERAYLYPPAADSYDEPQEYNGNYSQEETGHVYAPVSIDPRLVEDSWQSYQRNYPGYDPTPLTSSTLIGTGLREDEDGFPHNEEYTGGRPDPQGPSPRRRRPQPDVATRRPGRRKPSKRKEGRERRGRESRPERADTRRASIGGFVGRSSPVPVSGLKQIDVTKEPSLPSNSTLRKQRKRELRALQVFPIIRGDELDVVSETNPSNSRSVLRSIKSAREQQDNQLRELAQGREPPRPIDWRSRNESLPQLQVNDVAAWRRQELDALAESQYAVGHGFREQPDFYYY